METNADRGSVYLSPHATGVAEHSGLGYGRVAFPFECVGLDTHTAVRTEDLFRNLFNFRRDALRPPVQIAHPRLSSQLFTIRGMFRNQQVPAGYSLNERRLRYAWAT